jgi:hypothetical protein
MRPTTCAGSEPNGYGVRSWLIEFEDGSAVREVGLNERGEPVCARGYPDWHGGATGPGSHVTCKRREVALWAGLCVLLRAGRCRMFRDHRPQISPSPRSAMRHVRTLFAVATATALVAGAAAYAGSGAASPQRQRVAINMVVNDKTDTGTFTLNRLPDLAAPDPGEQLDEGTVAMGGMGFGHVDRNGMRVMNVVRELRLYGDDGTLLLVQRYDTTEMQNSMRVGVGTWKIKKGTGAYSGIKGGGRYVAVSVPNGRRTLVRQEGWVTVTG